MLSGTSLARLLSVSKLDVLHEMALDEAKLIPLLEAKVQTFCSEGCGDLEELLCLHHFSSVAAARWPEAFAASYLPRLWKTLRKCTELWRQWEDSLVYGTWWLNPATSTQSGRVFFLLSPEEGELWLSDIVGKQDDFLIVQYDGVRYFVPENGVIPQLFCERKDEPLLLRGGSLVFARPYHGTKAFPAFVAAKWEGQLGVKVHFWSNFGIQVVRRDDVIWIPTCNLGALADPSLPAQMRQTISTVEFDRVLFSYGGEQAERYLRAFSQGTSGCSVGIVEPLFYGSQCLELRRLLKKHFSEERFYLRLDTLRARLAVPVSQRMKCKGLATLLEKDLVLAAKVVVECGFAICALIDSANKAHFWALDPECFGSAEGPYSQLIESVYEHDSAFLPLHTPNSRQPLQMGGRPTKYGDDVVQELDAFYQNNNASNDPRLQTTVQFRGPHATLTAATAWLAERFPSQLTPSRSTVYRMTAPRRENTREGRSHRGIDSRVQVRSVLPRYSLSNSQQRRSRAVSCRRIRCQQTAVKPAQTIRGAWSRGH